MNKKNRIAYIVCTTITAITYIHAIGADVPAPPGGPTDYIALLKNPATTDANYALYAREGLQAAIRSSISNNTLQPLKTLCNTYLQTNNPGANADGQHKNQKKVDPHTEALILTACEKARYEDYKDFYKKAYQQPAIAEAKSRFSDTETNALTAVHNITQKAKRTKACKDIAKWGRFAKYKNINDGSADGIPFSRRIACAACKDVFEGPSNNKPQDPQAIKNACEQTK